MVNTRSKIFAAALDLHAEFGLDGVTMRMIASRIGLVPTAIYRHFSSKDALVAEVIEHARATLLDHLRTAPDEPLPVDRFWVAAAGYLEFAQCHPQRYRLLFIDPAPPTVKGYGDDLSQDPARAFEIHAGTVDACCAAGIFRTTDARSLAISIWALAHGLISLHQSGRFADPIFPALYWNTMKQTVLSAASAQGEDLLDQGFRRIILPHITEE